MNGWLCISSPAPIPLVRNVKKKLKSLLLPCAATAAVSTYCPVLCFLPFRSDVNGCVPPGYRTVKNIEIQHSQYIIPKVCGPLNFEI